MEEINIYKRIRDAADQYLSLTGESPVGVLIGCKAYLRLVEQVATKWEESFPETKFDFNAVTDVDGMIIQLDPVHTWRVDVVGGGTLLNRAIKAMSLADAPYLKGGKYNV